MINIADLYKLQHQVLKPLSPRQEYALIHLMVEPNVETDVTALMAVVLKDFPFTFRLYNAFVEHNKYNNVIPFIVPVTNSEVLTEEIFCLSDHSLIIAPELRLLLDEAMSRVESMRETADELRFCIGREPLVLGWFVDCLLDAYGSGIMPMFVRPTKEQQVMREDKLLSFDLLRDNNLFTGTLDFTKAGAPSERAKQICKEFISRLQTRKNVSRSIQTA